MVMENMLAYAEIDEILNLLEDDYRERVPKKVRDFFKEEKIKDYHPEIDIEKPLIEQNLKRETMVLLAILNLNYWCENEEEKQRFLNELDKNEEEKKELEEKYNPDNLFKKKQDESTENNLQIVEYKKPNFIQILLTKIKKILKREN
ncbi:MAG: hypothetical protein ACLR1U_04260 [Clostridia bacterium]|jgi:hypothetical protein|nr:hypothetical protein [Clostridium sp.]